jgi:membrane-bound metal-dependent hydrolase YbcI (DUF457 family)
MASFRTHISFGIALGVLGGIALGSFALAPGEWSLYILIALSVVVGAISPDIDSDSGVPFHITFASLSLVAAGLVAIATYRAAPTNYVILVGYPFLAIVTVWGVFGAIFKKFTRHRGMVHSIPAALFAGLVLFSFARIGGFADWDSFLLGAAFSVGYILHLVLDEVCSAVNFHGTLFIPNKALGSALKLFSQNRLITVLTYLACGVLIVQNYPALSRCVLHACGMLGIWIGS